MDNLIVDVWFTGKSKKVTLKLEKCRTEMPMVFVWSDGVNYKITREETRMVHLALCGCNEKNCTSSEEIVCEDHLTTLDIEGRLTIEEVIR